MKYNYTIHLASSSWKILTLHRISLSWPADQPVPESQMVLLPLGRFRPFNGTEAFEETDLWKKLLDGNAEDLNEQLSNWHLSGNAKKHLMPNSSKVWAMVGSTTGAARYKQSTTTSVGASPTAPVVSAASFVSISSWLEMRLVQSQNCEHKVNANRTMAAQQSLKSQHGPSRN